MLVLAHLSDLHATRVGLPRPSELTPKRALGWLSWSLRRRKEHRRRVLDALLRDLEAVAPDHVAVTGDLTNLGLEAELREAARWLRRLGDPERVTAVPGNHDLYAPGAAASAWQGWIPYTGSSPGRQEGFPSIRVRGELALVGVSSAVPTPAHLATGRVGRAQLERLATALEKLGGEGLRRVVLIHHPPVDARLAERRQLADAAALREVLGRAGAELVLHGHTHRTHVDAVPGPDGPIPVVGVPSSSAIGRRGPDRRARYHVYRIASQGDDAGAPRLSCQVRGFDAATGRFAAEGDQPVLEPGDQPVA